MNGLGYQRRVYFAERADTGLIKIGCSGYPKHRCKQLTIDHKVPITLLAEARIALPGLAHEKALHRRFADSRVEGEWFRPTDQIWRAIGYLRRTGNVHWRYRPARSAT